LTSLASADGVTAASASPPAIPFGVRLSWGVGSFGTITYLNTVTVFVLVYLTTVLKIEPAVAGLLVFVARLIDAFSDPVMGTLTDRTRSRWGRRRPWMLLGAVVCGASLPWVFSLHNVGVGAGMAALAFAALVVYSLGFTIFNVPYLTMPVEMTEDRLQRLDLMSFRSAFMMLGSAAGFSGAPWLLKQLGGDAAGYASLGLIAGLAVFVAMLIAVLGTARARAIHSAEAVRHVPIREQFRAVLDNRPFMMMVGIKALQFFALSAEGSTRTFFVLMVLKRDLSLLAQLGVATMATTLLCIPLFRWVGRFVTKRTGLAIGIVGEILATLSWLLATPEDSDWLFLMRGILGGIFGSAILLFSQTMWLDTIDYDRERTGLRREGLYTSLYVFVERLGYSLPPLILGNLLQLMQFDKNLPLEQQPASAELAVMLSLVVIPSVAYGLGLLFLWFYRLPERIDGVARV
jgi:glycoside/pentoside/hexuronide:cation symporter, GPH family